MKILVGFLSQAVVTLALSQDNNAVWIDKRLNKFDLKVKNFENTGRGLATTRDRKAGEVVLQVDDALTSARMLDRFEGIKSAAAAASPNKLLTDEQVLSLGVLEMRSNNEDYISTLPEYQYSVLTLPSSLESCLPQCYQTSVQASQESARILYDEIILLLFRIITAAPPPSFDSFLWAFSIVRSRSVLAPELEMHPLLNYGPGARMILPGIDLLNHKVGSRCFLEFEEKVCRWKLSSKDAYNKDDQIFLSYGDLDNLKLFINYGFCSRDNPNNLVFFDLDDLLQASSRARPGLFSQSLLARIKPQLETAVGTTKGEERAVFSYDDSTGPRESLTAGLNMMQQVAQQLYGMKDDEGLLFKEDIVRCLREIRCDEIKVCLTNLENVVDLPEGWGATKDYMRILLETENEILTSQKIDY